MNQSDRPWYSEGLCFECAACGRCCSGEPGFVWVTEEDIDNLADFLGIARDDFQRWYLRCVGGRWSLQELDSGDCLLFDRNTRRCWVYPVRPRQCHTWPFWDSNLSTSRAWSRVCAVCPGSGRGRHYSLAEIEQKTASVALRAAKETATRIRSGGRGTG